MRPAFGGWRPAIGASNRDQTKPVKRYEHLTGGTAVEILDQKRTRRAMRMYSAEQRMKAVETFARFGCSAADTIAELGYPTRHTLLASI